MLNFSGKRAVSRNRATEFILYDNSRMENLLNLSSETIERPMIKRKKNELEKPF
jgi:hypothetical protein